MVDVTEDIQLRSAEIRVEGLFKRFGELQAVGGVSLHIRKQDFYTFLGPSGCGKTTLLRMIAGFIRPDAGDIFFDDRRMNDVPPWRRDIGMVFQNFALWPHMTVFDNIAFGLRERKAARDVVRDRVHAALKLVDLEGLADRRPSQLSGGQQQRVALARTLVIQPRGLLLDEPLSNLDAKLRIQMRNELVRLQRDLGITTIYVTHDQEEALALSTRVAVFSRGVVVQEGTPKEIYEAPRERSVADFVGTSNFLDGEVTAVDGDYVSLASEDGRRLSVAWRGSFETAPRVGAPLLVSVRPESVRLVEAPEAVGTNRIVGEVTAAIYLGASVQYDVALATGRIFKVNLSNPRQVAVLDRGAAVCLAFSPHDAVLLPSDGDTGMSEL